MQGGLEVPGELHYNLGRGWVGTSWDLWQCLESLGVEFVFNSQTVAKSAPQQHVQGVFSHKAAPHLGSLGYISLSYREEGRPPPHSPAFV